MDQGESNLIKAKDEVTIEEAEIDFDDKPQIGTVESKPKSPTKSPT